MFRIIKNPFSLKHKQGKAYIYDALQLIIIILYCQMTTNRMFVGSRYEPQGRNANLAGSMFKRTPIFTHIQPEKQIESPFANYKTNQSFSSQTTAEQKINPETLRALIKQELAKQPSPQQNNRKLIHTLQAQITDLKERICQYEKENNTKIQETSLTLKEEMKAEAERMDKEVEQEITSKLRSFFQKVNVELKKDILKNIEDEFLTISYGEDVQSRLDDINSHIESLQYLVNEKKVPSVDLERKIQQASLVQNIEPKLNKIEKEVETNRKHQNEMTTKLKVLEEWMGEQQNKRIQFEINQKIDSIRERIKGLDQEINKKIGTMEINNSNIQGDITILKDKISELQKYNEEQRNLFLDFNKKLSNSRVLDAESTQLSTSLMMNSSSLQRNKPQRNSQTETQPVPYLGGPIAGIRPKEQNVKKSVYQFDTENYLMDGDGNYILTEEGKPIKLSEQQVQALLESNLIEVE